MRATTNECSVLIILHPWIYRAGWGSMHICLLSALRGVLCEVITAIAEKERRAMQVSLVEAQLHEIWSILARFSCSILPTLMPGGTQIIPYYSVFFLIITYYSPSLNI